MAKKKTIEAKNIKTGPALRADVGGDQPTPTPEQTGTRTYQIMDPWKDRDVVNLVDVKAVDGEITEVKVNGEPAGGGGFSTVTVNITNSTQNEFMIYLPNDMYGDAYAMITCSPGMNADFDIILGSSGLTVGKLPETSGFSATGEIEIVSDTVSVRGPGSIHR